MRKINTNLILRMHSLIRVDKNGKGCSVVSVSFLQRALFKPPEIMFVTFEQISGKKSGREVYIENNHYSNSNYSIFKTRKHHEKRKRIKPCGDGKKLKRYRSGWNPLFKFIKPFV